MARHLLAACAGIMLTVLAAGFCTATLHAQSASVLVKSRAELVQAVRNARPGATILIAPGTYDGGFWFEGLQGTAGKPIVLAAADPGDPPIISGGNVGMQLTDPAYVELRDLVITKARGNGLNIDDGGSYSTPAHHVVLKGLVVRDIGQDANHDGIKLSGLDDFVIEGCTVERWGGKGSGIDMVGCHRGVVRDCTFREGNAIYANAVQMKGGSSEIAVRHCRFDDAGGRAINAGGSTGLAHFRPQPQGYEAKDLTVEDCTFVGSMSPIAFVGVDGAVVQHNVFYRPTRWVIRILQETREPEFVACRNGKFLNNIIAFRDDEVAATVNVGDKTAPETFTFAGNYWYCLNRPDRTQRLVQLPTPETGGVYGQDPQFRDAPRGDFQLAADSPAKKAGPRGKEEQSH